MNKFIVSIVLSMGMMLSLITHNLTENSGYVNALGKNSKLELSTKELKTYKAVDPRRTLTQEQYN
ncbi:MULTISPECIES: hypothetical protein [Bacillus cereus group]|uniref:hypothetical protein n=1 Tax=Bacillus cereus group TaxID=86661 RepID=UPI0021125153|nr:hypothetical protein [Bacillus cereus]